MFISLFVQVEYKELPFHWTLKRQWWKSGSSDQQQGVFMQLGREENFKSGQKIYLSVVPFSLNKYLHHAAFILLFSALE